MLHIKIITEQKINKKMVLFYMTDGTYSALEKFNLQDFERELGHTGMGIHKGCWGA